MKLYRPVNTSAYTLYDEINSIVNRLIVVSFYLDYLEIFRPSIGVYLIKIKIHYYDLTFTILIARSKQF